MGAKELLVRNRTRTVAICGSVAVVAEWLESRMVQRCIIDFVASRRFARGRAAAPHCVRTSLGEKEAES